MASLTRRVATRSPAHASVRSVCASTIARRIRWSLRTRFRRAVGPSPVMPMSAERPNVSTAVMMLLIAASQIWAGRTMARPLVAVRAPVCPAFGTVYPHGAPEPDTDSTGAVAPDRAVR